MARGRPKSQVVGLKCSNFWKAFELMSARGGVIKSGTSKYDFKKAIALIQSFAKGTARRFDPDKEWAWELKV